MVKQSFSTRHQLSYTPKMIGVILMTSFFLVISLDVDGQAERTRYFPKKTEYVNDIPRRKKVWIFILAGQSNMAGRGLVEPQDTVSHRRIMTIDRAGKIILAKEPLHFYEPQLTGLDCGLSFAKALISEIDSSLTILLMPAAVGGSSTHQWLGDSLHRNVKLQTNFKEKIQFAKKYGTIKGILWHQGESDAEVDLISGYEERLGTLFTQLRGHTGNSKLPVFIGELGAFSENQNHWDMINNAIHHYVTTDKNAFVIDTEDLGSNEDKIHFNSEGQRRLGERFARKVLEIVGRK